MKRARGGPMGAEYTTECWSSAAQYVHDRSLASGLAAARVESLMMMVRPYVRYF